jgi:hypothetical protein
MAKNKSSPALENAEIDLCGRCSKHDYNKNRIPFIFTGVFLFVYGICNVF